jgi:phosphoenolpyruvate-protein kinase (PTS system EI component)
MCGEMAGIPLATMLLVGLGFTELSMSPGSILKVKKRSSPQWTRLMPKTGLRSMP